MKEKLEPERERLEREERRLAEQDNGDKRKFIEHGFNFPRNLPELFTSADLEGKLRFPGSVFPQKIVFENGTVPTTEQHLILIFMSQSNKALRTRKASNCSGALTKRLPLLTKL